MKEQTKITDEELLQIENLKQILIKYNIPEETYLIGDEEYHGIKAKICLQRVANGYWNTCIKLKDSIFNSCYFENLLAAIIKFISCVASTEEQSVLMTQEFLNSRHNSQSNIKKYLRKKL